MPKYISQKEAFLKCKKEGDFIIQEGINLEKIKSTIIIAQGDIESAEAIRKNLPRESIKWNGVYKLYYDSLHELTEAFLGFDKIKTKSHQALFAYLCEKYPELEFSWEFFEKVRTKRNGINYYGAPIDYNDWKEAKIQFILYTKKLKEEIEKKL